MLDKMAPRNYSFSSNFIEAKRHNLEGMQSEAVKKVNFFSQSCREQANSLKSVFPFHRSQNLKFRRVYINSSDKILKKDLEC